MYTFFLERRQETVVATIKTGSTLLYGRSDNDGIFVLTWHRLSTVSLYPFKSILTILAHQ